MSSFRDSEEAFHEAARAATGLRDFGDDRYREGLKALLGALDDEAQLGELGDLVLRAMIVQALQARLRTEASWAVAPAAAGARIESPIFIVGLPRTGTTALQHRMLQNPALQGLELFLSGAPKPRPPREAWPDDPDFIASDRQTRSLYDRSPEMKAIHFMAAELPDECWRLFSQDFAHSSWEAQCRIPSYAQWWAEHDMRPVYERHRRNLQLIGHREPERRWLLKDATHLFALDALLDVYPDATIVQTHRDPVALIGSVCSLCWTTRQPLNDIDDPSSFGEATLALWERALFATMETRRRRPRARFIDVGFERFVEDPLAVVRELHQELEIPYEADARARVERFHQENPAGKHGRHAYDLATWNLREEEIRERFRPYAEAFDLSGVEPRGPHRTKV